MDNSVAQATSLAAVQAQIIALSHTKNSARIEVATNAFGFMGVIFGVALLSSAVIQTRVSVIDRIIRDADKLSSDQLEEFLRHMERGSGRNTRFVCAVQRDIVKHLEGRVVAPQGQ